AALLADAAQLPPMKRQAFQIIAALCAVVPPLYDTVVELRTLGGYIETFVLMLLLLISVFQLTRRWHTGASSKELALRWAGIGLIAGVGLWVDPLLISALLAATLWVVGYCVAEVMYLQRQTATSFLLTLFSVVKGWLLAIVA